MNAVIRVGSSAKPVVAGIAGLLVLYYDNWKILYFIATSLMNALLSKVLKVIIRAPRPAASKQGGHGMPSSHAQTLAFFTAVICHALYDHYNNMSAGKRMYPAGLYITCFLGVISYALASSYYRVVTGLHTVVQTLVGIILGSCTGNMAYIHCDELLLLLQDVGNGHKDGDRTYTLLPTTAPLAIRVMTISMGAVVLYYQEFRHTYHDSVQNARKGV